MVEVTNSRQIDLFAVPVLVHKWPEAAKYRDEMIAFVEELRAKSPGIHVSNVEGWHSETNMPEWDNEGFRRFTRWAAAMASVATARWNSESGDNGLIENWRLHGWANINPPGGAANFSHHHINRDWNWSGSFYLKLPKQPGGDDAQGRIVLEDKFIGISRKQGDTPYRRMEAYQPKEGEMVMFPSWLYHSVEPHNGEDDRISIAMNFASRELESSRFWTHRRGFMWRKFPGLMRPIARLRGSWDQTPGEVPPGYDVDVDSDYI